MCQCGGRGYYSRFPPGHFPAEERRRPCEANTDAVYFPELCKPSVARHKVKVKESNLLYRFTQLGAAAAAATYGACLSLTQRYATPAARHMAHRVAYSHFSRV